MVFDSVAMKVAVTACAAMLSFTATIHAATAARQAEAKKDVAAAGPVATDVAFQDVLADYQMILREIERLEGATGTVEIPVSVSQLRERANMKMGKIRGWMKEHNVSDDWRYDAEHRAFLPPAKVEAKKP